MTERSSNIYFIAINYGNIIYLPYFCAKNKMSDKLKDIFHANNGYLETRELKKRSEFYQLKKLVNIGEVVLVKRGLYRLVSVEGENEFSEVCRIVSSGVICLYSAWQYYELTTFISSEYYIAIPSKIKRILPDFPPIRLMYWKEMQYLLGQTRLEISGENILIYDLEKSVCDAVKYRMKVGEELMAEILKNYLKRTDRNLDKLLKYAQHLKVETVLLQNLKLIL